MNYFIAKEIETGYEGLYEYSGKINKKDYVVIPNCSDEPVTAIVVKTVSRYNALTSNETPQAIIDTIDVKGWQLRREKELDNVILLEKMQGKISQIKLLEQLEKYASRDTEMAEFLNEFKKETTEPINDNTDF
ncbi:hypothetical protein P1O00_07560 [Erysipelothrix rhusiopathiae]|nr:hypothetical protein [Erysipelothrix rhusiopathiae]MDE9419831.1 hypothetical protein [Erysipelothrix rhusiopathiae]